MTSPMAENCVVVVDLVVGGDALVRFMPLLRANAAASLALEPGCLQFDVCVDPAERTKILLYEIYVDDAAFAAHLASAHYRAFDEASQAMIARKAVRRLTLTAG